MTIAELYKIFIEQHQNFTTDTRKIENGSIFFALKGYEETINDEIVECLRVPNWEITGKPLVHQYRYYYPKQNYTGRHSSNFY
jgi:hypothetical protein